LLTLRALFAHLPLTYREVEVVETVRKPPSTGTNSEKSSILTVVLRNIALSSADVSEFFHCHPSR
jgi:hypothetical protein